MQVPQVRGVVLHGVTGEHDAALGIERHRRTARPPIRQLDARQLPAVEPGVRAPGCREPAGDRASGARPGNRDRAVATHVDRRELRSELVPRIGDAAIDHGDAPVTERWIELAEGTVGRCSHAQRDERHDNSSAERTVPHGGPHIDHDLPAARTTGRRPTAPSSIGSLVAQVETVVRAAVRRAVRGGRAKALRGSGEGPLSEQPTDSTVARPESGLPIQVRSCRFR